MNVEHLIQMANQIGAYFSAEPDRAAARAEVAEHLARFWEKRMRQSLYAYLDSAHKKHRSYSRIQHCRLSMTHGHLRIAAKCLDGRTVLVPMSGNKRDQDQWRWSTGIANTGH